MLECENRGGRRPYARSASFMRLTVVLNASSGIKMSSVSFPARLMSSCRCVVKLPVPLPVLKLGITLFVAKKQSKSELPRILVAEMRVLMSLNIAGVVVFVEVSLYKPISPTSWLVKAHM